MKLILDTLDDRREVWGMLSKLPPDARLSWLKWCCDRASGKGRKPTPDPLRTPRMVEDARRCDRGDDRLTSEVYLDFWALTFDYSLDPLPCVLELERRVRSRR